MEVTLTYDSVYQMKPTDSLVIAVNSSATQIIYLPLVAELAPGQIFYIKNAQKQFKVGISEQNVRVSGFIEGVHSRDPINGPGVYQYVSQPYACHTVIYYPTEKLNSLSEPDTDFWVLRGQ
jgi:hypothetical protein